MRLFCRRLFGCILPLFLGARPLIALDLYVADFHNNSIERFDSGGHSTVYANSGLDGPMGLAFDNSGDLYVGNWNAGTVVKFDSSGHQTLFAAGLSNPRGLACDSFGNLYVANYNGGDVVKFDSAGHGSVFAAGLNQPTGLTFDSHGNLFEADRNNQILKIDSGGHETVFASTGSTGPGPEGLVFDPAGNLYVANYWNNAIYRFGPNGSGGIFASTGSGYNNPFGLAYANGTLYASCNVDQIEAFDANGNATFFASTLAAPWFMAVQPVPEPSAIVLLLTGTGLILQCWRPRPYKPTSAAR